MYIRTIAATTSRPDPPSPSPPPALSKSQKTKPNSVSFCDDRNEEPPASASTSTSTSGKTGTKSTKSSALSPSLVALALAEADPRDPLLSPFEYTPAQAPTIVPSNTNKPIEKKEKEVSEKQRQQQRMEEVLEKQQQQHQPDPHTTTLQAMCSLRETMESKPLSDLAEWLLETATFKFLVITSREQPTLLRQQPTTTPIHAHLIPPSPCSSSLFFSFSLPSPFSLSLLRCTLPIITSPITHFLTPNIIYSL